MYNEKVSLISPRLPIRLFTRETACAGDAESYLHFHAELEFLYVKSGALKCSTTDTEYIAHTGDILFLNSNTPHQTSSCEDSTVYQLLQFRSPKLMPDSSFLHRFLQGDEADIYIFPANDESTAELTGYMDKISEELSAQRDAYDYYLTANIYLIVALLHRLKLLSDNHAIAENDDFQKLLPAIYHIEENYQESVSLDFLASLSNLTKYYFCHLFKKSTGKTAIDYLNFVRICKACELLKGETSVTSIAYTVGFSSLSYFTYVFNKYKACSPQTYRKMSRYGDIAMNL